MMETVEVLLSGMPPLQQQGSKPFQIFRKSHGLLVHFATRRTVAASNVHFGPV